MMQSEKSLTSVSWEDSSSGFDPVLSGPEQGNDEDQIKIGPRFRQTHYDVTKANKNENMWETSSYHEDDTWDRILVQVTIYRRLLIGRDGHLDQSEACDIS